MKLVWDQVGEKTYETGVSNGVLYPAVGGTYPAGVPWNGLISVKESPSGAEAKPIYADNKKYLNIISAEDFGATIEAYTYPVEFDALNGIKELAAGLKVAQQKRGVFGLCYKTLIGNDTEDTKYGYKYHFIYGAQAAPSEKSYRTTTESTEAMTMSWTISTTAVEVAGSDPSAIVTVDSTSIDPAKLAIIEDIIYGTESTTARLPLPDELASIIGGGAVTSLALSTVVPADNATAVAVGASVVLTFNNKISAEAITVVSATGSLIACNKTVDATGKILTFKPVSNLTASTKYFVTLAGVSDIYNQTLTTVVKSFTTA